jgi:hypothetical protein
MAECGIAAGSESRDRRKNWSGSPEGKRTRPALFDALQYGGRAASGLKVLRLRIPIQGGQVFRFDGGQRSDMIPATVPI